jgi:hypothetical protein
MKKKCVLIAMMIVRPQDRPKTSMCYFEAVIVQKSCETKNIQRKIKSNNPKRLTSFQILIKNHFNFFKFYFHHIKPAFGMTVEDGRMPVVVCSI